jgi:signal transduction histidine kinase
MREPWARWPAWTQTIRFRLTLTYSLVLFGLAALVVAGIYMGVSSQINNQLVTERARISGTVQIGNEVRPVSNLPVRITDLETFENAVNAQAQRALKRYSLLALSGLFVLSLGVGWWLSGRALRPVRRITATAQEITASDLSRRIHATGPDDELRQLADTVDAMLNRLDDAFGAQRQLVDDASHELRNPLAIIQTNVEAVLSRADVTPEERAQAAQVVARATTRMSRLVEDLLASSRRAAPAFTERDLELAAVADEAADELALLAEQSGVSLRRDTANGGSVIGDRDALRRAVANLISNAVRFSPEGGDVLLATGRRGDWGYVAVRDHGVGIPAADQRRVFDRFYRGNGHTSHDGHAGLGLAIVRQIVESHGGHASLFSAPGAGSTFILWLPLTPGHSDERREITAAPTAFNPIAAEAHR